MIISNAINSIIRTNDKGAREFIRTDIFPLSQKPVVKFQVDSR